MRVPGRGAFRRLASRLHRRFAVNGVVLMYHRVVALDSDPWGLAVSPAHFSEHLKILRSCSVVSLPDLVQGLSRGHLPRRPVIITFDDGYADNWDTAKPALEQHDIPATVFLATGAIGSNREFWWDELGRVLLAPGDLPNVLDLRGPACSYRCELGADTTYTEKAYLKNRLWKTWEDPPTARHAAYSELWRQFYPLPHNQKSALLDELLDWAGLTSVVRSTHRLISLEEVKQMGGSPLIEVGAHSVTHPALPELPLASQRAEIQESKSFLEALLNQPVSCFSYPHGDYNAGLMSVVREAGFTSACTTAAGSVSKQSDCFALPRFHVLDWNGEEFRSRLEAWCKVQPPK